MGNLTQKDRHKQALKRTAVHNNIIVHREMEVRQILAVLQQMQVPFRLIAFQLFRSLQQSCRLIQHQQRILRHVII
ncbi:hypothetical protein D3C75_1310670 [compost metagenome]